MENSLFRVLMVGPEGVGKSSIFAIFAGDRFLENYISTIGTHNNHHRCGLQIQTHTSIKQHLHNASLGQ
jgi:GTPase SAR1 family protein